MPIKISYILFFIASSQILFSQRIETIFNYSDTWNNTLSLWEENYSSKLVKKYDSRNNIVEVEKKSQLINDFNLSTEKYKFNSENKVLGKTEYFKNKVLQDLE